VGEMLRKNCVLTEASADKQEGQAAEEAEGGIDESPVDGNAADGTGDEDREPDADVRRSRTSLVGMGSLNGGLGLGSLATETAPP